MKLLFENWREYINEKEDPPERGRKRFWDAGEEYHPGSKTIKTKTEIMCRLKTYTDEKGVVRYDQRPTRAGPPVGDDKNPWLPQKDTAYWTAAKECQPKGREFIQTDPTVFSGRSKPSPETVQHKLEPKNIRAMRKRLFRSYKSGINRKAWTGKKGYIRRQAKKGLITQLKKNASQEEVEKYYENFVWAPKWGDGIKDRILNTPYKSTLAIAPDVEAYYREWERTSYTRDPAKLSKSTAGHELGHAVDPVDPLHPGHGRYRAETHYGDVRGRKMSFAQYEILKEAFPWLPDLTIMPGTKLKNTEHWKLSYEIYTDIINARAAIGRFFTAGDIKMLRAGLAPKDYKPDDLEKALKHTKKTTFSGSRTKSPHVNDKKMADILNQISKVIKPSVRKTGGSV